MEGARAVTFKDYEIASQRLAVLRADMEAAFEGEQWQRLAELDETCQVTLREIIETNPRIMFDELRDLLAFYQSLVQQCEARRADYAQQVAKLQKSKQSHQVYSNLQHLTAAV